ncbi:MAG: hypothetical protein WBP44_14100 [Gammaproteobacteria bacterium]
MIREKDTLTAGIGPVPGPLTATTTGFGGDRAQHPKCGTSYHKPGHQVTIRHISGVTAAIPDSVFKRNQYIVLIDVFCSIIRILF